MPTIKITSRQVKIHQDYFDFMPRWSLEKKEYEKAIITSIDEKPQSRFNSTNKQVKRAGDLGEPEDHWPRIPTPGEIPYYEFIDKITDKQNKFHPARDQNRIPVKGTGALRYVTGIMRLKTEEKEFLLSKGSIIGHDAAGEEVPHYLPWPEMWIKTVFTWNNEYNNNTKQFEKRCLGPSGTETVYMLEFNKQNAKELFDQRANDIQINFIVKDEISQEARRVEPDINIQKTFERFANNSFDYLWAGEYIPLPVRQELRQEAVARGLIKGGAGDFQVQAPASKGPPGVR